MPGRSLSHRDCHLSSGQSAWPQAVGCLTTSLQGMAGIMLSRTADDTTLVSSWAARTAGMMPSMSVLQCKRCGWPPGRLSRNLSLKPGMTESSMLRQESHLAKSSALPGWFPFPVKSHAGVCRAQTGASADEWMGKDKDIIRIVLA